MRWRFRRARSAPFAYRTRTDDRRGLTSLFALPHAQHLCDVGEYQFGAVLPIGRAVASVDEHDLFGIGDVSTAGLGLKDEARQRNRMEASTVVEIVDIDDALVGFDQVEASRIIAEAAIVEVSFQHLNAAWTKVERAPGHRPLVFRSREPLRLELRIGPRAKHARWRRRPDALEGEGAVAERRNRHVFFFPFRKWRDGDPLSSTSFPRRSKRCSQRWRRSLSHCSARATASAEILHVRVRPIFSVTMRPLASSTCTCW